jgi:hypothetical protein
MHSFRRLALLLAMGLAAMHSLSAQISSSNPPSQNQGEAQQSTADNGQISVQARIRMRREQRRTTAIHDAYDHRFDTYLTMGYMRFVPGPSKQRLTFYAWDTGLTRYYSERLGVSLDARGYYGTAFVGLNHSNLTRPAISQYDVMLGPTYRFYVLPKFSLAVRGLAGVSLGNFSGDTNGLGGTTLGLYPDATTFAATGSVVGEYNVAPGFALRLAPEYVMTGYGSTTQASRGFTIGFVYRYGKQ